MKYTKEQRLDIGKRIYDGELSRYEAAEEYGISDLTARDYMRQYRDINNLPPKHGKQHTYGLHTPIPRYQQLATKTWAAAHIRTSQG